MECQDALAIRQRTPWMPYGDWAHRHTRNQIDCSSRQLELYRCGCSVSFFLTCRLVLLNSLRVMYHSAFELIIITVSSLWSLSIFICFWICFTLFENTVHRVFFLCVFLQPDLAEFHGPRRATLCLWRPNVDFVVLFVSAGAFVCILCFCFCKIFF